MKYLIFFAVLAAGAWFYLKPLPPGQGPEAAAARRSSASVINALEGYRSARGIYPASLEDLTPEFLGSLPVLRNGVTFDYQRIVANYRLTFNYSNPLPVHCWHDSNGRQPWTCEWF